MKSIWVGFCLIASVLFPHYARAMDIVVLGALGGIQDGNLSSFMIHPRNDTRAVACDAGSLVNGLRLAQEHGSLDHFEVPAQSKLTHLGYVLTDRIKGYLITHAHLDHVLGLLVASPDDSKKTIYGLAATNKDLETTYFNWKAWPNFSDRGARPLKKYSLEDLKPGIRTALANTAMEVTAYPLSHGGVQSTAYLLESADEAVLCIGDTGPDAVEKSTKLADLWLAVSDLVKRGSLKAIIMEASYPNDQPDQLLFGHLTPNWLMKSLRALARLAGADAMKGLPVVVSHIKYSLELGESPQQRVSKELQSDNDLGLRFVFPQQGERLVFE